MSSQRRVTLVLLAGGVPWGSLIAAVVVPALAWTQIPERVADHWGLLGTPNGSNPKVEAFGIAVALAAVGAGILAVWGKRAWPATGAATGVCPRSGGGSRLLVSGLIVTGLGAFSSINLTIVNLGAPRWQDARQSVPTVVVLLLFPLALGAAGTALARRHGLGWTPSAPQLTGPARLGLRESERAFWLSQASNRWALWLALAGVGVGAALGIVSRWGPAMVVVASSLAVLSLSSVSVQASAAGVVVRYGPLHWPRTRIALRQIVNAEAVDLTPKSWGYRGSLWLVGTAAVIIKTGTALSLSLAGGKSFLVTVDDAATAAALLNDELARDPHGQD